ncbi:rhodanese-like domain-containing protein [Bacillus sp. FJAT-27251]|uniref:rhodanese-like domain-containing protein n=1 Tax=Bacillus sp. FJAT-27251 TaxID=1684142 RepID=UPI0006A78DED|nr:rhodanese-like domain-containing protein [Bacillus sp. FJAT-27251]
MSKLTALMFSFLFFAGCSAGSYKTISVSEAETMMESGNVEVIDVRTPEEYSAGHIRGSKLVPLQSLKAAISELDKEKEYVIVCRSGNRSAEASSILAGNGFLNIFNMSGGMNDWTGEVERPY